MEQEMPKKGSIDLTLVEFDGQKGRIVFHGNCLEMHPFCQAFCCRKDWAVPITAEEYASGQYDAEAFCLLTDQACREPSQPCLNRRYRLNKRKDQSCVYLEGNHCGIYDTRPNVCRDFQCQQGWTLTPDWSARVASPDQKPPKLTQETFVARLTDEATFVLHPLIRVHTVFYLKPRREIIFVKQMVGACAKFHTRDSFDYPHLDDAQLLVLIDLFNRKETLGEVYANFCSQGASRLTQQEFYAIVWLLNKHNIVLDSRNFQGMLSGMGGIG